MNVITIENDGQNIVRSNYWDSEVARAGRVYCSVNAGAIRVLLPPAAQRDIRDMQAARVCVLSRGPWPEVEAPEAVEILFDDDSDAPFALHMTPASFDMLPGKPTPGRTWVLAVWAHDPWGEPHRVFARLCHWRRVPRIPWMKSWGAA